MAPDEAKALAKEFDFSGEIICLCLGPQSSRHRMGRAAALALGRAEC